MENIHVFTGFCTSQVVQDVFHQQYLLSIVSIWSLQKNILCCVDLVRFKEVITTAKCLWLMDDVSKYDIYIHMSTQIIVTRFKVTPKVQPVAGFVQGLLTRLVNYWNFSRCTYLHMSQTLSLNKGFVKSNLMYFFTSLSRIIILGSL